MILPQRPRSEPIVIVGDRICRRLFWSVALALVALALLDHIFEVRRAVPHLGIRRLFNCAREGSIPSWFSVTLLTCTGLTLLAIARVEKARGPRRRTYAAWLVLAGLFVFMSVDDAAQIHERLGSWLGRELRDPSPAHPAWLRAVLESPVYSWQIFLGPFFGAAGIFMLTFLWRRFGCHGLRRHLVLGLACYAVALGLDAAERFDAVFEGAAQTIGWRASALRHAAKVTEELLEMLGTTWLWLGFVRYGIMQADGVRVRFEVQDRS